MGRFFYTFLHQPFFNALVFLYNSVTFNDLGLAIILLTIIVRLILYPLFYKSFKSQTLMQKIQPEVQKIRHDHKENKEKQAQALLELYKRHKVNPFSSFLLIFVQLPVLIVLYQVFSKGLTTESFQALYSFIREPETINHFLLGLIDLSKSSILIVVFAAVLQYFQGRLSLPKLQKDNNDPAAKVGRSMVLIGPIMTFAILTSLPSAVGVYWFASSAFSIFQQLIINKSLRGPLKNERGIQTENKNPS